MLDTSDPVIANCLIDHRRIEFVLLCETKDEAANTMLYNPPPKYTEMYTMNGDQIFSWPCFRLYPTKPTSARFLSADVEQLINKCRSDRDHLNTTLRQKTEEVAQVKNGIKKKMEVLWQFLNCLKLAKSKFIIYSCLLFAVVIVIIFLDLFEVLLSQ